MAEQERKRLNRKPTRLSEYDYSSEGAYFLTVCSKGHRCIFSRVVGGGVLDAPRCELSGYGKAVEQTLLEVAEHYENIHLESFVIMPNHIHLLLMCNGTSRTPSPTAANRQNALIPSFIGTWKRFANKSAGAELFQRSYYDHIIRDEMDYIIRLRYIEENPAKWSSDEFYQD